MPSQAITLLHLNIRSIRKRSKFVEFCSNMQQNRLHPDVMVITETWLSTGQETVYTLDGYNRISCVREDQNRGGGILVFIGNKYIVETSNESKMDPCVADSISFRITNTKPAVHVLAVYRRPESCVRDFEENLFEQLVTWGSGKGVVIGDCNVNWLSPRSRGLKDVLICLGWINCVSGVTRQSSGTNIDHVYTNLNPVATDLYDFNLSDHMAICCTLRIAEITAKKRNLERINFEKLSVLLGRVDWGVLNVFQSSNDKYTYLLETILNNIRLATRKASAGSPPKNNLPFITKEISDTMRQRNKIMRKLHKYKRKKNETTTTKFLKVRYTQLRNKCVKMLKDAERRYYEAQIRQSVIGGHSPWKTLKRLNREDLSALPSKISVGACHVEGRDLIQTLNEHLIECADFYPGEEADPMQLTRYIETDAMPLFSFEEVDEATILHAIKTLGNPSAGYDKISAVTIKNVASEIAGPLRIVVNSIIRTSEYPDALKKARVVPIPKIKPPKCLDDFRPISVLPILNKVVETVLVLQLTNHVETNNLLYENQYGYRRKRGTAHAVYGAVESIKCCVDSGKICGVLFIDVRKAFDSVRREVLLEKFGAYGVEGKSLKLIESYLTNRTQSVQTETLETPFLQVKTGVPQGSKFGPLAFLLLVNDLPRVCSGEVKIYADDTSVIYKCNSYAELEEQMQKDLSEISRWCRWNLLQLNVKKTHYMIFTGRRSESPCLDVVLDGNPIMRVAQTRFLGCILDERLDARAHLAEISNRVNRSIFIVKQLCSVAGRSIGRTVYEAYVQSHMNYCPGFWGMAAKTSLIRLFRLQKRAVRAIQAPCYPGRSARELGILPLPLSITYNVCTFLHQQIIGSGPRVLELSFLGSKRITRAHNNRILRLQRSKTRMGSHSFGVKAAKIWNNLPNDIRNTDSIPLFKKRLKRHLMESENGRLTFF